MTLIKMPIVQMTSTTHQMRLVSAFLDTQKYALMRRKARPASPQTMIHPAQFGMSSTTPIHTSDDHRWQGFGASR